MNKNMSLESNSQLEYSLKVEGDFIPHPNGVFEICDGYIKTCNIQFANLLGYTVEEIINKKPLVEIIHADDWKIFEKQIDSLLLHGSEYSEQTIRIVQKNNEHVTLKISLSKKQNKFSTSLIGSAVIDAGSKNRETSFNLLKLAVQHVHEGIVLTDMSRTILFANEPFTKMVGYSLDELCGKNVGSIFDNCANISEKWTSLLYPHNDRYNCELVFSRRDGSHSLFEVKYSVIKDPNDTPISELFTFSDISENDRAMGELRRN
ncbi:MAG: PAS domain S-box protein, partial [Ignavibacteriaceae bacterium]|nr:PAS domain S-box protein [Ignavibacteriaceae bacterium]